MYFTFPIVRCSGMQADCVVRLRTSSELADHTRENGKASMVFALDVSALWMWRGG